MVNLEIDFSKIKIELLTSENYCPDFDCSENDPMRLNEFYHKEALNYQSERLGRTYVFLYEGNTVGFATIAMSKIVRNQVKRKDRLILPQTEYPAVLLGRLAVDNKWRRRHIGINICRWCIGYSITLSEKIGCRYVILQTDSYHKDYYINELGFKIFHEEKNKTGEIDYWLYHKIEI